MAWPLLSGKSNKSPHGYFLYFGGSKVDAPTNYRAMRDGRWKLIIKPGENGKIVPVNPYDLGEDLSEKYDRLTQRPEIAKDLLEKAREFYLLFKDNRRPLGSVQ